MSYSCVESEVERETSHEAQGVALAEASGVAGAHGIGTLGTDGHATRCLD